MNTVHRTALTLTELGYLERVPDSKIFRLTTKPLTFGRSFQGGNLKGGTGFDTAYPPGKSVDFSASYTGKNNQVVSWKPQPGFADGKEIDLLPHFTTNTEVTVYLARRVTASEECNIRAIMGSDDTLTVWLNGQKLLFAVLSVLCRVR